MVHFSGRHQTQQRPGRLRRVGRRRLVAAIVELVAGAVLSPAAVRVLDGDQPVGRLAHARIGRVEAGRVQRAQRRPRAIDIVDAPAAEPAAVRHLLASEIIQPGAHGGTLHRVAKLGHHADAAGADIGRRRVEQRAVIGKGNVVEVVIDVVGVEGAPAAILTLQSHGPLGAARHGLVIAIARAELAPRAIHGHDDDRRIVQIRIMGVAILEGPTAGTHLGAPLGPIALHLQLLQRLQPGEPTPRGGHCLLGAHLHHGVGDERGVPDRRDAGLAVGLVLADHQKLVDRATGDGAMGMLRRIAQRVIHHHGIRHGGVDRAQPVLAVQALRHEGRAALDGAAAQGLRPATARPPSTRHRAR